MKKTIVFLLVLFSAMLVQAQKDSLRANRYVMRSMLFGAGYTNVLDTYLSPLEYKGCEIRILRESMRMTRLMDGNVSSQNILQAYTSYTKNTSGTSYFYTGMLNWSYALHYQFQINERLKILFGPVLDLMQALSTIHAIPTILLRPKPMEISVPQAWLLGNSTLGIIL